MTQDFLATIVGDTVQVEVPFHVVLTNLDPITKNLIRKLEQQKHDYVILAPELQSALEISDL